MKRSNQFRKPYPKRQRVDNDSWEPRHDFYPSRQSRGGYQDRSHRRGYNDRNQPRGGAGGGRRQHERSNQRDNRGRGPRGPKHPVRTDPHNARLIEDFQRYNLNADGTSDSRGVYKYKITRKNIGSQLYLSFADLNTGEVKYKPDGTIGQISSEKPLGWDDVPIFDEKEDRALVSKTPSAPSWSAADFSIWRTENCVINGFVIERQYDKLSAFDVKIYEKGASDEELGPEVPTDEKELREEIVVGIKPFQQRRRKQLLKRDLGVSHVVFDNNKLYAIGSNIVEGAVLLRPKFDSRYRVEFRPVEQFHLTDGTVTSVIDSERVLSIVARAWCERINFHRIGDRSRIYFDMSDNAHRIALDGHGADCRYPDIELLDGKEISVRKCNNGEFVVFIRNGIKPVTKHSLLQIAHASGWRTAADVFDVLPQRTRVYLTHKEYEEIQIHGIDMDKDENHTFERFDKRKDARVSISVKQYHQDMFRIRLDPQPFLVRHRSAFYPPQLIRLPVSNDMMGEHQDRIRRMRSCSVETVMEDARRFVQTSNARCTERNQGLKLSPEPRQVRARRLEETHLRFVNKHSGSVDVPVSQIKNEWKHVGGRLEFQPMRVTIVVPLGRRDLGTKCFENLKGFLHQRRFNPRPIDTSGSPQILEMDMMDEDSMREHFQRIHTRSVIAVLPYQDTERAKKAVTRAFYFGTVDYTAPVLQCVEAGTAMDFNKARGAFEGLLTKAGCAMYQVIPRFRHSPVKVKWQSALYVGIHLKTSSSDSRGSIACICASTNPFAPVPTQWESRMWMFDPKIHVMSLEKTQEICTDLFESVLMKADPSWKCSNVFVFRDKGADGDVDIIKTKEIAGVRRAIYGLTNKSSNPKVRRILSSKKGPSVVFMSFETNVIESIGIDDEKEVVKPTVPVVIDQEVNGMAWQALMHVGWSSAGTYKPVRVKVLHDDLKLTKKKKKKENQGNSDIMALYQVIYALHFSYGVGIPFSFGCPTLTGPIKYAKHWCDWFSDILDENDTRRSEIYVSKGAVGRPQLFGQDGRFDDAEVDDDGDVPMR